MNHEVTQLMGGEDIIKVIKAQRLKWFGHIQRREPDAIIKKILDWKPVETRPRGRPKLRWLDQVTEDIKRMGIEEWRRLIMDRKEWNKKTNQAKTHNNL